MEEKATIYDLWRMCKFYKTCLNCPLRETDCAIRTTSLDDLDDIEELNEIILKWCKEHPVKIRQDKFLEMFPNAHIYADGVLQVKPCNIDENIGCGSKGDCDICRNKYWLGEVEE